MEYISFEHRIRERMEKMKEDTAEACAYRDGQTEDVEELINGGLPVCEACYSFGGNSHEEE